MCAAHSAGNALLCKLRPAPHDGKPLTFNN